MNFCCCSILSKWFFSPDEKLYSFQTHLEQRFVELCRSVACSLAEKHELRKSVDWWRNCKAWHWEPLLSHFRFHHTTKNCLWNSSLFQLSILLQFCLQQCCDKIELFRYTLRDQIPWKKEIRKCFCNSAVIMISFHASYIRATIRNDSYKILVMSMPLWCFWRSVTWIFQF